MSTENSNITSEYYIIHVILKKWDLQSTKNILNRIWGNTIKLQYTDMHTNFELRSLNWSWNSLVILELKAWKYVDKNNIEFNQKDAVTDLKRGCMKTWNLFFTQNWQQRFDCHFTVWESFLRLTKTYFMKIQQLRRKYSDWYAWVYLSFTMFWK